ncbi:MAG: alcohol dehydrogenase catalytic domain-containing protein [Chloroflexi bacterium]|nr:alcohol dehydrogenase catalytic domain-containing protein [Chloroflexota bacterium]
MKALFLEAPGDKPDIRLRDVSTPHVGENDALVQIAACGLCHHDVAVMAGLLRRGVRPDIIMGHEISGVVQRIGASVQTIDEGDRVVAALTSFCGNCDRCRVGRQYRCREGKGVGHAINGGFAQYVALPATSLIPVPDGVDLVEACVAACPVGVGIQAITDAARVQQGETVLVAGAGGGLGAHAVQVAAAQGARVIGVTTSPDKIQAIEALGDIEVILSTEDLDFSEIAMALTGDEGADVVVNTVGSAVFASCLASLSQFGRMVVMGEVTGANANFSLTEVLFRDATVVGSTGASPGNIAKALDLMSTGAVKPVIHQRMDLSNAEDAFKHVRSRQVFGRIVLIPPSD